MPDPMMPPTRRGLDAALVAVGVDPNSPKGQAARALEAFRKCSACVDHVERRIADALARSGSVDASVRTANEDDLADAARLAEILRASADAARYLIDDMRAQIGESPPKPDPEPEPEPEPPAAPKARKKEPTP